MPWDLKQGLAANSSRALGDARQYGLSRLVPTIGKLDFLEEMARYLHQIFHAEFMHISHIPSRYPTKVISLSPDGNARACEQSARYLQREMWRHDPSMAMGCQSDGASTFLMRLSVQSPETPELKRFYASEDIGDRVVLYGKTSDGYLGLSIVRSAAQGLFSGEEQERIGLLEEIAFPLLVHHYNVLHEKQVMSCALTSLEVIEQCLASCPICLPVRERQVVARLLYGMTCEGVAIDLSIAYETAISYKKRFFKRFDLTSFRDLVVWYLALFSEHSHLLSARRLH